MRNFIPSNQKKGEGLLWALVLGVLSLFSLLYQLASTARTWLYQHGICRRQRLKARVISVGNVTVGGTGKTPLVLYLAEKLREKNRKVAILTRGYRRKKREMVELTHETCRRIDWQDVGDEPYLLAKRLLDVPIMVSKRRSTSGEKALQKFGSEILILDDGLQHLRLSRELDIVVIDSVNPFGNGRLLPAGILREPLTSLKRADIFVLTKTDHVPSTNELVHLLRRYNPQAPIVESVYRVRSIQGLFNDSSVEPKRIEEKKAYAFSGIGNPASFENTLEQLKIHILKHRKFTDHYPYSKRDLMDLEGEARGVGADFAVTTEKDSVRIPLVNELEIPFYVVKIDLRITQAEKTLLDKIQGRE
ncbi:MAG: tetraacyldisaccharide 4'-kinase [candidate division Zixibacteria bacterium]|nr:tetraacyldisaccharide 4'-kinase [candidate division Zixibacteria bacterium]